MTERRRSTGGGGARTRLLRGRSWSEAAKGIREGLGFGGEVEEPVPLEEVELRAPRLKAPGDLGDLFSDDRHERVCHALGKAYRDVVRGFRGEFENPPDLVALPRDESEIEAVLSWAEAEGAAVVPFGGGTSVVGGVEGRLGERPFVSLDLRRLDRVLEVDATSLAARIQAGATGPGPRGASCASTASPCATSRSPSSTRPWAAGWRPGPAATSPPSTPTSTTWSSRCGR